MRTLCQPQMGEGLERAASLPGARDSSFRWGKQGQDVRRKQCRSGNCLLWFSDPQARTEVPSVVRSGARRWSRCSAEQSEVPLRSAARTLPGRGAGWPTEVEGSKAFPDTQPSPGAGTLRQLNPDFLSQLPVPRPRGLGNSRAPAAGHRSTLSRSNCTSSSCLK